MAKAKTTAETLPISARDELHEAVMLLWVAQTALGELEHSDSLWLNLQAHYEDQ